mgnify:CR=1 FL=1
MKMKPTIDEPGLRWTRENRPAFYAALAEHIVATPGVVQIEVSVADEGRSIVDGLVDALAHTKAEVPHGV